MLKFVSLSGLLIVSLMLSHLPSKEDVVFNRIKYIYHLKKVIDKEVWEGFSAKKFDLPLIYYTDDACYVANPTKKFIAIYSPSLAFEDKELKIFKTKLIDKIPFHMETSMTFGEKSTAYNHRSPFMNCSSFEITQRIVPDVNSTEQWATMVIHEYFHGFQFKHSAHLNYFEKGILISSDTLRNLYNTHLWFKESVDKENRLLLEMLDLTDEKKITVQIDSFFLLRDQRRSHTLQELNADVAHIEEVYETMEGTARYVEYSLYNKFAQKNPDTNLQKSDSSYHSYQYFQNYHIEKDPWLYLSEETNYVYATGFNLVRLLDKLKISYRTRLFREGGLSLEQILKQAQTQRRR